MKVSASRRVLGSYIKAVDNLNLGGKADFAMPKFSTGLNELKPKNVEVG